MADVADGVACVHACSMACGRTYDVIIVQVVDGSTLFLCMPDLISFTANVAKAMVEPDDVQVREVMFHSAMEDVVLVTDSSAGYGIRGNSDPSADDDFEFDGDVSE